MRDFTRLDDDSGFTMIELMVSLAIVGILMGLGIVMYGKAAQAADDVEAQLDLVTAVKVQSLALLENGQFTVDEDELRALEPNLQYSLFGDPAGTIAVRVEPGRADRDVCVFAISRSNTWYSMYHSTLAGDLYGNSAPVECTPANVASWSREAW